MQVIAKGALRVKILHLENTDGSPPYARWFHPECFADDEGIQTRAMLVDRTGTEKILERIAAEQDAAAAVPSPLPSIRRPRAWLSLNADAHACTDARKPCGRCFCAQLARFRNRAVSAIARRQAHAGRFDRPAGGGIFSCRGHARDGKEKRVGRG